jgi:hypothetical protein
MEHNPKKIRLGDLYTIAAACNNEGGAVAKLLRDDQKWFGLHFVLDRPLIDGRTLADLNSTNTFPLKDSSIIAYDEGRVNQTCLLVLSYLYSSECDRAPLIHVDNEGFTIKYVKSAKD